MNIGALSLCGSIEQSESKLNKKKNKKQVEDQSGSFIHLRDVDHFKPAFILKASFNIHCALYMVSLLMSGKYEAVAYTAQQKDWKQRETSSLAANPLVILIMSLPVNLL